MYRAYTYNGQCLNKIRTLSFQSSLFFRVPWFELFPLQFVHRTVRATLVFSWDGSSGRELLRTSVQLEKKFVWVPVSVPTQRCRWFRFCFLENRSDSSGFGFWFSSLAILFRKVRQLLRKTLYVAHPVLGVTQCRRKQKFDLTTMPTRVPNTAPTSRKRPRKHP